MRTASTLAGSTPVWASSAAMATPPSSLARRGARVPASLPIGVRRPATITLRVIFLLFPTSPPATLDEFRNSREGTMDFVTAAL